jgi:DNA-directed RNA polymerase subunit F|tara:strand:+ start:356 stop:676 length:321 start_codon:yes stop_codon:yes gene_type:complete
VQKLAYREKKKAHVSRYLDYLIGQKESAHRAKSLNDRELTLDSVRRCLKGEITLSTDQIASANILAKASGLFVTQIADVTPQSSVEITAMLERKLSELELTDDELH